MWYDGSAGDYFRIGYATSPDGINWTKNIDPVLDIGSEGEWDDEAVFTPSVVLKNDQFIMYYSGYEGDGRVGIGCAKSPDGVAWTKEDYHNPILIAENAWEENQVGMGSVLLTNSGFHMWYMGGHENYEIRTGYATSADGLNWDKYPTYVLNFGLYGKWDFKFAGVRSVYFDGEVYHLWYSSHKYNTSGAIGYATSKTPEGLNKLTHSPGNLKMTVWNDGFFGIHHSPTMSGEISWNGTNGVFGASCTFGTLERGSVNGICGFGVLFNDYKNVTSNYTGGFTEETVGDVTFDQVSMAVISDARATVPYKINTIQKTYSVTGEKVVFCRSGYVNVTGKKIFDLYASIGADWDIGNANANSGGVDTSANLVYVYEPGTSSPYFGFAVLGNTSGCYVGTTKYPITTQLRKAVFTYSSNIDLTDPGVGDQMAQIGSYVGDIAIADTAWVTFAVVAGRDFEELRTNTARAFEIARAAEWTDKVVAVENTKEGEILPIEYGLNQNYPNPFNPSTTLKYEIPKESYITLKVFDILGREVATLVNKQQKAGYYEVEFDASNLTSGVYFYKIMAGDFVETKKMVLLR